MRREMRIFAHRQADNQAENSITEAHSNPLWSVDSRGAGQHYLQALCNNKLSWNTPAFSD